MNNPMLLHLYSQGAWHDAVRIHGTRDALTALRDQLSIVLGGWTSTPIYFVTDGEGFQVEITIEDKAGMDKLPLPYTEDIAKEHPDVPTTN